MNTDTIQSLKTLYAINRLGSKRESGKSIKMATQIVRILSLLMLFAFIIIYAVIISKLLASGETNLYEAAKYLAMATGPFLAYDFLLRASLPTYLLEELPSLYTLPIKKKNIILFKLLYNSTGPLVFMWVALLIPILGTLHYYNAGFMGIIHAFFILLSLFTISKLIIFLVKYYIGSKKVLTLSLAVLYYGILSLPAIGYKFPAIAEAYGSVFLPVNAYWIIYTVLLALLIIVYRLVYITLRNYKIDSNGNNASDNSFQFNSLSKSSKWDKLGKLGEQIKIDLLFIFRNKKVRALLFVIVFFSLYSIYLMSTAKVGDDWIDKIVFPFSYAPLIFYITFVQYESAYMDFYFTKVNQLETMLKSKMIIVSIAVFIQLIPIIVYSIYLDYDIMPALALYSFVPGLLSLIGLCPYIFNSIGIDPDAKTKINKNFGGMVFLIMFGGAIIIPLIMWILHLIFNDYEYIATIILNGLIIASSSLWIRAIAKAMNKRKYKNLEGIRNSLN